MGSRGGKLKLLLWQPHFHSFIFLELRPHLLLSLQHPFVGWDACSAIIAIYLILIMAADSCPCKNREREKKKSWKFNPSK